MAVPIGGGDDGDEDGRELSPKARRFAELYRGGQGGGVWAAKQAGYTGTDASLASRASRLLADPRVQRLIADRRAAELELDEDDVEAVSAIDERDRNRATLRAIRDDKMATPTARTSATKLLEELVREDEEREAASSKDPHASLRAHVNERIKMMRERELETGCCVRCGQRLPDRDRDGEGASL